MQSRSKNTLLQSRKIVIFLFQKDVPLQPNILKGQCSSLGTFQGLGKGFIITKLDCQLQQRELLNSLLMPTYYGLRLPTRV